MTPKEKAIELYYKYYNQLSFDLTDEFNDKCAKQCALIAVDEILNSRVGYPYPQDVGLVVNGIYNIINYPDKYWKEVKIEIEKL